MGKRPVLRWSLMVALTASLMMLLVPFPSRGFAPKHHMNDTVGPLEGAGFFYGTVWLLAYFDIEVDIASEVPNVVCRFPLRWPTQGYVCPVGCFYPGEYDPWAPDACFDDWVNHSLPFHSPGTRPAKGLAQVTNEWNLPSVNEAMHVKPGERCYDTVQRFGHMLHAIQDFYSHANWVEVFHIDLGFEFEDIPTWTSFQIAQRGGKLNLILLQHAKGDEKEAKRLYDRLEKKLEVTNHDLHNKDSNDYNDWAYNDENHNYHSDNHGHNVIDFHERAKDLAGIETYQRGLQLRLNILNNPKLGEPVWKHLNTCVEEMAAYDGVSFEDELETYKDAIWRLHTYGGIMGRWE